MIHTVRRYNLTLTTPDHYERGFETHYKPLVERVVFTWAELDDVMRKAKLILKAHRKVLVVLFEPDHERMVQYDSIESRT